MTQNHPAKFPQIPNPPTIYDIINVYCCKFMFWGDLLCSNKYQIKGPVSLEISYKKNFYLWEIFLSSSSLWPGLGYLIKSSSQTWGIQPRRQDPILFFKVFPLLQNAITSPSPGPPRDMIPTKSKELEPHNCPIKYSIEEVINIEK